jgi:hypothetical protein
VGKLVYGPHRSEWEFDDRMLAHLRVVIVTKFRRRESFTLSWELHRENGGGRISLWLDPAIPLEFHFVGGREPSLNREWIEQLATIAGTTTGLVPLDEPGASSPR